MARTGGRTPYDKALALAGPVRALWALSSVALPTDLSSIVQQVADVNGEYPAKTGWNDLGLSADAPSWTHGKDTEGLEYEQVNPLFEQISEITRTATLQLAEFDSDGIKIIENSTITEAVAASAAGATDALKKSAQTKIHTGLYSDFIQYRIALISYRPTGSAVVTEPLGRTRPPAVARVLPLCVLSADETEISPEAGSPTNAEVQLNVLPDSSLGSGKEHGYWVVESPGAIAA